MPPAETLRGSLLSRIPRAAATERERFLLALLGDDPDLPTLAAAECDRLRCNGAADYLAILGPELLQRWLDAVPARDDTGDPLLLLTVGDCRRAAARIWGSRSVTALPAALRAVPTAPGPSPLFQSLGSHNPYHVGHRVMIRTLCNDVGTGLGWISVSTMGRNRLKNLDLGSYAARHAAVINGLATAPSTRRSPVSAVDIPTGVGACHDTLWQSHLLATLAGDEKIRVVMGSDKFAADMAQLAAPTVDQAALARLRRKYDDPARSFLVVVRAEDDPDAIRALAARHQAGLAGSIRVLPKVHYWPAPASSTRIRQLRQSARPADSRLAERFEHGDVDRNGEIIWPLHPQAAGQAMAEPGLMPNDDSLSMRYQPEHGCIGRVVPCRD
jgi:hypothetical protein